MFAIFKKIDSVIKKMDKIFQDKIIDGETISGKTIR